MEDTRVYEMTLPSALADEMVRLSYVLGITMGEVVSRALRLLTLAVDADRVILTMGDVNTNVLVK